MVLRITTLGCEKGNEIWSLSPDKGLPWKKGICYELGAEGESNPKPLSHCSREIFCTVGLLQPKQFCDSVATRTLV